MLWRWWGILALLMLGDSVAASDGLRLLGNDITSIHFIGDLHGDVDCATAWVSSTGLVDMNVDPWKWIGGPGSALVFLGDYVDKGPFSRSVLELVRRMEESFPQNVVAILGNHDLYALLDAVLLPDETDRPMGVPVSSYAYAFAHPQEFIQAGWSPARSDDAELLSTIFSALQNAYTVVREAGYPTMHEIFASIKDRSLGARAEARFNLWHAEWATGLIESGLGAWLACRPLVAVVGDALIVHAGIPLKVLQRALKAEASHPENSGADAEFLLHAASTGALREGLEHFALGKLGSNFTKSMSDSSVLSPMGAHSVTGGLTALLGNSWRETLVTEMVTYRGFFRSTRREPLQGCAEVRAVLQALNEPPRNERQHRATSASATAPGAGTPLAQKESGGLRAPLRRIVVGHTPRDEASELCGGALVAADSSLSRPFRAFGNHYCPVGRPFEEAPAALPGSGCEAALEARCEGSISKLTRSSPEDQWPDSVEFLSLDPHLLLEFDSRSTEL